MISDSTIHFFCRVWEGSWASSVVCCFFGHSYKYLHWGNFNDLGKNRGRLLYRPRQQQQPVAMEIWLIPWLFGVSDFLVRCYHLFHFKSFMQEHLTLCNDKAVRSPDVLPWNTLTWRKTSAANNSLKLVFTEAHGKFAMMSTEAKTAEEHSHLLYSIGSPWQVHPNYIQDHVCIRSISDPHIALSSESSLFWVEKKIQNIHSHLHLKTNR